MKHKLRLEIHFHQEDEASGFLESNATQDADKKLGELLLYAYYLSTQLVSLGRNETTIAIATVLNRIEENKISQLAYHKSPNGPALVDYKGHPGRKLFVADLTWGAGQSRFGFQQKGFGWFGQGIGYYCPQSILMLLQYLARRRIADPEYLGFLDQVGYACSGAFLAGQLALTNSHAFAQGFYPNVIKQWYPEAD